MTVKERDLLEDLANEQAEGESELFENEDAYESEDAYEEDAYESEDAYDLADGFEAEDSYENEDSYESEDGFEAEGEDAFLGAVSSALSAESEDAFFKKLVRGVVNVAKKAAPIIGKVARAAAPVLSVIPHPAAQVAAKVARLASNLRAEAEMAGEGELGVIQRAAEAAAEMATRDRRARPVVVGLVTRQLLQNRAAAMSPAQRMRAVQQVSAAAKTLTNAAGAAGLRALPRMAASVNRTASARGTPTTAKAKVLLRTAQRIAAKPEMASRLAQPNARAQQAIGRGGGLTGIASIGGGIRRLRIRGPAEIIIRRL